MEQGRRTRVKRDPRKTRWNMAGALVLAVFALFFISKGGRMGPVAYIWGAVALLPALFLAYRAWAASAIGECPACDMYILGLSTGTNYAVLCPSCGRFVEGENGELAVTPDERVAPSPVYTAEVPNQIRWPEGCCVCGKPRTRSVEVKLVTEHSASLGKDMAVRMATLGTAKLVEQQTFSVQVPHCQEHSDGAALFSAIEADQLNPAIGFRWHGYMRRFCELNGVKPRS